MAYPRVKCASPSVRVGAETSDSQLRISAQGHRITIVTILGPTSKTAVRLNKSQFEQFHGIINQRHADMKRAAAKDKPKSKPAVSKKRKRARS